MDGTLNVGNASGQNASIGGDSLTKIFSGTLNLGGTLPNTFTGPTTVSQGVLRLNKTGTASEVQTVTVPAAAVSGSFALTMAFANSGVTANNGVFTSPTINFNANPATLLNNIQAALTGVPSFSLAALTGNWANGATTITGISGVGTTNLGVGMLVTGTGIPAGTVITAINSATSITISNTTTAQGTTAALTFGGLFALAGVTTPTTAGAVTGSGPFTITFQNSLGGTDQPAMTVTSNTLVNSAGPAPARRRLARRSKAAWMRSPAATLRWARPMAALTWRR